jgi:hypothetical protein
LEKKETNPSAPPIIKVGAIKECIISTNPKTGRPQKKKVLYTYRDVFFDIDGWADCKRYLPEDYDLVYMRLARERTIPGWISGTAWMGIKLKDDDIVKFWKRKEEVQGGAPV